MKQVRFFSDNVGHERIELLRKSLATADMSITLEEDAKVPYLLLITDALDFAPPAKPKYESLFFVVKLKPCDLPKHFGQYRNFDLSKWRGSQNNTIFKELVAALQTVPLSSPSSPSPPPTTRSQNKFVQWFTSLTAMAVLSALLAFALNFLSLQNNLCSINFGQPTLSDFCGRFGLGGKPVRKERIAWEAIEPRQCEPLRRHIELFPDGAFHDEAADQLEARRSLDVETWTPQRKPLTLFVVADGDSHTDQLTAKNKALERGKQKAKRLCQSFAITTNFKLNASMPVAQQWRCDSYESGYVCGFEGQAICDVEVRQLTTKEVCGPQS